jgi:hypothetical protein
MSLGVFAGTPVIAKCFDASIYNPAYTQVWMDAKDSTDGVVVNQLRKGEHLGIKSSTYFVSDFSSRPCFDFRGKSTKDEHTPCQGLNFFSSAVGNKNGSVRVNGFTSQTFNSSVLSFRNNVPYSPQSSLGFEVGILRRQGFLRPFDVAVPSEYFPESYVGGGFSTGRRYTALFRGTLDYKLGDMANMVVGVEVVPKGQLPEARQKIYFALWVKL